MKQKKSKGKIDDDISEYDAIIIGAGPAGCEIAYRLAKSGFSVIVFEKERLGREKPCGGGIQLQEILEFGVPSGVMERKIKRTRIVFPNNRILESSLKGKKFAATVKRSIYDRFLQERAKKAGALIIDKANVVQLKKEKNGKKEKKGRCTNWLCKVRRKNRTEEYKARLAVNAAGFSSDSISKMLLIPPKRAEIGVTYHYWAKIPDINRDYSNCIEFYSLNDMPKAYAWVFPKKDFVDVGIGALCSDVRSEKISLKKELDNFIRRHPVASKRLEGCRIIKKEGSAVPFGILPRLFSDSAILIGDAGGFASIIHGGGIYHSRKSAKIASYYCTKFLKTGSQRFLEGYDREARDFFENNEQRWDRKVRNILYRRDLINLVSVFAEKDEKLKEAVMIILRSAESHEKAYKIIEKKLLEIIYSELDKKIGVYKRIVNSRLGKIFSNSSRIERYANGILLNSKAKRLRASLGILASQMFGNYFGDAVNFSLVYELFHTASLVHDDIIDETSERRGRKTINARYGINNAIITGDIMLAKSYTLASEFLDRKRISKEQILKLFGIIGETGEKCCIGESLDVEMAEKKMYKSINRYLEMVRLKTGSLIAGSLMGGAVCGNAPVRYMDAIGSFGRNLGIAFQIIDDSLDLLGGENANKSIMNDLKQGKATPMLIFALKKVDRKEKAILMKAVGNKNITKRMADEVVEIYRKHEAIEYAQKLSHEYVEKARKNLMKLPAGEARKQFSDILDVLDYWSLLAE